jgi:hypothetical protein
VAQGGKVKYKEIKLGEVELDKMVDDDAIREEAKRKLPNVLVQIGEQTAAVSWEEIRKVFKTPLSEKRKFIREGGKNFNKSATHKDRQEIEDVLVERIKELVEAR